MRHRTNEGGATVPVAQLQSFARQRATMGGSILRHDPLFSRAAASQKSVAVTQGEDGH